MARASKPNIPEKFTLSLHYAEEVNAIDTAVDAVIDDYLSQTDSSAQSVASALTLTGSLVVGTGMTSITKLKFIVASGTNPIVVAHGMGATPKCVASPNALQPYAHSVNADGTNISIRHNAAASLTFWIIAWV